MGERKRYIAVHNKVLRKDQNMAEDTVRLIDGAYFNHFDHVHWIEVSPKSDPEGLELDVVPERWIRSGSLFEAEVYPWRQEIWSQDRSVVGEDTALHFNLKDYFTQDEVSRLMWYGIFTLEDIANEKPASVIQVDLSQPQSSLPLRTILMQLSSNQPEVVERWIELAKETVLAKEAVRQHEEPPVEAEEIGEEHVSDTWQ